MVATNEEHEAKKDMLKGPPTKNSIMAAKNPKARREQSSE
jgi:hypothetical protein